MSYSGKSSYSFDNRSARTTMYKSQSFDKTFEQQAKGEIHESMNPKNALLRESRDSEQFPNSLPVIFGLDITGSMDYIPNHMIKDGLPKLISLLHERGLPDAAVLFMGLGDSKCDKGPFQVGQFESSDEPMDLWLTRTWIEKKGGGNGGESYGWAWWFAANRCVSDAWEKRKQKGFLFTVGDDNCHNITSKEFQEVLGINHETVSKEDLYKAASEKWHVYHFNMQRGRDGSDFTKFMGENLIQISDEKTIPELMAKIISSHAKPEKITAKPVTSEESPKVTL